MAEPAPERPELLAIIAPDYRWAQHLAREHGLNPHNPHNREWIYVRDWSSIRGRKPGRYLVQWPEDGPPMGGERLDAWDWMIRRGWRSVDES